MKTVQMHPLDGLLQECLPTILMSQPKQSPHETKLSRFSSDDYNEWRSEIPNMLGYMVEQQSNGTYTVYEGRHLLLHSDRALQRGTYFVRTPIASALPSAFFGFDSAQTVLFEINPYRLHLVAGVPMHSAEER